MDGAYSSKHGDDMKLVLYCTQGWACKKAGGVGGGAAPPICRSPPPFAKRVMIRATFPYCTHGDDMMFVFFIASMDGLYKSGGVGRGAAPPDLQTQGSGQPSSTANMAMT